MSDSRQCPNYDILVSLREAVVIETYVILNCPEYLWDMRCPKNLEMSQEHFCLPFKMG